MHALYEEWLPPSGVEFAATLKLTPSTLGQSSRREVLCNVVTARGNTLSIYEVREETATSKMPTEAKSQKKDDAMEGVKEERQTPVVQVRSMNNKTNSTSDTHRVAPEHECAGAAIIYQIPPCSRAPSAWCCYWSTGSQDHILPRRPSGPFGGVFQGCESRCIRH